MSATVGAVLKKIALAIVTEPETLKKVLCIVLAVIVGLFAPVCVLVGFFNMDFDLDIEKAMENISAEEIEHLEHIDNDMNEIESTMINAGYSINDIQEAQIIYILILSSSAGSDSLVPNLVNCFANNPSDEILIQRVNSTFNTQATLNEFQNVMNGIRSVYVDTTGYVDTTTKNNLDLVTWANNASESKWGYVYGTYGTILDRALMESKAVQYPSQVGENIDFIESNWLGRRTADCIGLIKGYSWYDVEDKKTVIGLNDMPDISANGMFDVATEKGTIDTIPEIPGVAVWLDGHIGIYVGDGMVVQAANTTAGVVKTPISVNAWTHWLKIPYISYLDESENNN